PEAPRRAAGGAPGGAGAVGGGDAPGVLAVAAEAARVADGVGPLHVRRAAGVLEVVDPAVPHVGVLEAAEVDPAVRELVDEEGPGPEVLDAVELLPAVRLEPRGVVLRADGVRRRAEGEGVEDERLVVALPAGLEEAGLGPPSVRDAAAAVERP